MTATASLKNAPAAQTRSGAGHGGTSSMPGTEYPDGWPNCECGCGQPAPAAKKTEARAGVERGQPRRFIQNHRRRKHTSARRGFGVCNLCAEEKPLEAFYRQASGPDGWQNCCKACSSRRAAERYREKGPDLRRQNLAWREENREAERERKRQYREKNPAHVAKLRRQARERNAKQEHARSAVRHAIERGEITKPRSCGECGTRVASCDLHGHHDDYDRPLDVEWLCRSCHMRRHRLDG